MKCIMRTYDVPRDTLNFRFTYWDDAVKAFQGLHAGYTPMATACIDHEGDELTNTDIENDQLKECFADDLNNDESIPKYLMQSGLEGWLGYLVFSGFYTL